jgi:hypothetical protein
LASPLLVGGRPGAEACVRSPRFWAAGGFLPDSQDVAGRVGEQRNPERAFRVGLRDDLPAMGGDGGKRAVDVELAFGTKAQLLKTAIDVAIAGDHDPVAVLDRDWATAATATATVHEFLAVIGRTLRPAMARSAGLVLAAYDAAGTDPAVRELAERLSTQRAATVAWIIDGITDRASLREGVTRRHAIDQVWLLMDPAVYHRLTRYRGWSPARYEKWFTDTTIRLLLGLPREHPAGPCQAPAELSLTARSDLRGGQDHAV